MGKKEKLSAQDQAELDALNNQTYSSDQEELDALNASVPAQSNQPKKVGPAPQVPRGSGVSISEGGTSGLGATTSDYLTFQTAEEKLTPKKTTSQIPMAPKKEPSVKQTSQVGKGVTGVQGPTGLTDLKNVTGPMGATGAVGVTGATDLKKKDQVISTQKQVSQQKPMTGAMGVEIKTTEKGVKGVTEKTGYLVSEETKKQIEEKKKDVELSTVSKAFDNFKLKSKDQGFGEIQEATNFYLDYLKSNDPDEYKYQSERLNYNKDNPLERQKIEVEFINKGLDLKRKAIAGKSREISRALSDESLGYADDIQRFKDINSQLDVLVPKIEQINSELSSYPKDQNGNIIINETNKRKVEKLISDYKTEYQKYQTITGQRDELLNSDFGTLIKKADELAQEDKKNYDYAINLEKTIKESDKYPELKKQLIEEAFLKETENKFWDEMPEWVKWSVDSFSGVKRAGTELIKGLTFLPKVFGEKAGYGWTDKFAEFSDKMISNYERIEAPISPNAKKDIFDYERNLDGTPKLDEKGNKIEKTNWSAIPYQVSNGAGNLALFIVSGGAGTALESANLLSKIGLGARGVNALNKIGTFAMGYTMSAKGNYDEAKANGMSEADAIAYSKYKSIADGAIELIFPEQKLITPTVRKSAAKLTAQYLSKGVPLKDAISRVTKKTLGNVVGENVEELAALGTDYAAKVIAEKATGTDFKVDDDLMNQVKSTVLVTSILTAPFGIVGAKGVKNQMENQSLFLAANKPNEVLQNIQDLLDSKVITEEQANTARERIKIAEEGLKSIPKEYSDDKKATALSLLVDKKILENKKKEIDPVFHENIDAQIKEKDAEIKKDISRDDNGLTLEQNDELEDLKFKKDNGVITEAEQKKLDELNKFVDDYKKPKAEKTTKTLVTVEVLPEGQRFPSVTEIPKEEFEAYKQANPTANIVYERQVEEEIKPEEETEVEQETKKQEDAVQKQATGQVPLQPETKIGGEMEERKPQTELEISAQKVEEKPIAKEEVKVEEKVDALKDVESTARALEGKDITTIIPPKEINALNKQLYNNLLAKQKELLQSGVRDFENNPEYRSIKEQISLSEDIISNNTKAISEAYHKAKADGSNPELVKAVEELLAPKELVKAVEQSLKETPRAKLPKDQAGRTVGSTTYVAKENPKGRTVTRTAPDGTRIKGTFKLVSAEDLLPSHNPKTFSKNESFPQNKEGKTINDRDYETDKDAQGQVINIAQNIDGTAVTQTPIVSKEGIVYDGNNRTMSRQLAAENQTDSQYLDDLNEQAEMYGFTKEQVASVKNPTLVFEVEEDLPFTTETMAKFNKQEKKSQGPIQRAVAISKSISDKAKRKLASLYDQVETPSEVTSNPKMMKQAVDILVSEGLIQSVELPRFYDKGVATPDGVSLLEGIILGSALDEDGIRALGVDGMGNIRKMIIKNTVGLIQNATKGENALTSEIKGAIDIVQKAKAAKVSVADFLSQTSAFEEKSYSLGEMLMGLLLETNSPNKLKQFLSNYNQDVGVENLMGEDTGKQALLERGLQNLVSNYEKAKQNLQRVAEGGIEEGGRGIAETETTVGEKAEPTAEEKTIKQKAEDLNKKIDAATEKLKNTIVDKNANNRLFSAPMITPKMISDLIDLSSAVIKKSITAGATIAQAVNDGINAIKNHPRYKRFVEAGQINEENFEKQVRDNYADLIKEEETRAQEEAKKKEEEAKKEAPPAKPPVTTEAEKGPTPEGKKERATATRILENKKFHEDVVKRLSNEAIFYEPTSVKKSEEFVNAVIDEYEANGKLDDLVNEYMADKSDVIPDNQKLLFGDFLTKKLEDIATKEQNEFVRETLFDKAEQVFEKTAKNTTTAAQQLALIRNRDTRMFSNEIYMRRYAKKQFSEMQDNAMSEAQKNDIKSAQTIIDEYRKSNEFAKEVEQATAEELKKIGEAREGAEKTKKFNDIIDSLKVNLSDC
jgi:hypothetical protein